MLKINTILLAFRIQINIFYGMDGKNGDCMAKSVYEIHIMQDARLPFIFHDCEVDCYAEHVPNWHDNIELLFFTDGEGELRLGAERFEVHASDVAVVNPEMLHTVYSKSKVNYYCLIIDGSFCEENGIDVSSLEFQSIISDGAIYSLFLDFVSAMELTASEDARLYAVPAARAHALSLLSRLCEKYVVSNKREKNAQRASSQMAKDVIIYLRSHIGEKITLDGLAAHIGVSKYHLSREFKRESGKTVFEYFNILRCKEARKMLRGGGVTVAEAAEACGFCNFSYFTRSFKKYMGTLPSQCEK